jgi:hypothetical protein
MKVLTISALVLLAAAGQAEASPCGGGSSGGGSSSGGSSSGGSSSGGSSSSSTPACDNSTNIVGRAGCRRFGGWDRSFAPRMRFGIGLTGGTAAVSDEGFDGQVEHQEVHNYHYPAGPMSESQAPQMGSAGIEMHASGLIGERLHAGVFVSMEGGDSNAPDRRIDDLMVSPRALVQFKTGGELGVTLPMGKWMIRADALVGLRSTGMTFESTIADCTNSSTAWNHKLLLEPRVGIERWLNPWLSTGVMVGSDVMREQDLSIGIGITGHTSAFDSNGIIGPPR